jgi:hypothetical protein
MLWVDCWVISHMGGAVWFARHIIKVGVIGTGIYILIYSHRKPYLLYKFQISLMNAKCDSFLSTANIGNFQNSHLGEPTASHHRTEAGGNCQRMLQKEFTLIGAIINS